MQSNEQTSVHQVIEYQIDANKLFAYWVILHAFLSSDGDFQNHLFRKILSEILS